MTGRRDSDDLSDNRLDDGTAQWALEDRDDRPFRGGSEPKRLDVGELALTRWSVLMPMGVTPSWMRVDLARLESAFPEFSFTISRNWRGFRFEAWRNTAADGLYAVITDDPNELWHELEMAQR